MPAVYEIVCFIKDDLLNTFFQNKSQNQFQITDQNKVAIKFSSSSDFQKIFDLAQSAQRRQFNNEEHACGICMRKLLGDKFFFLSGCEHFFCLECLKSQLTLKINNAQVN